jgi:hypothetical protein
MWWSYLVTTEILNTIKYSLVIVTPGVVPSLAHLNSLADFGNDAVDQGSCGVLFMWLRIMWPFQSYLSILRRITPERTRLENGDAATSGHCFFQRFFRAKIFCTVHGKSPELELDLQNASNLLVAGA